MTDYYQYLMWYICVLHTTLTISLGDESNRFLKGETYFGNDFVNKGN